MDEAVGVRHDAVASVVEEGGVGCAGAVGYRSVWTVLNSIGDGHAVVGGNCGGAADMVVVVGACLFC